ncbi:MAG: aminotransferase class I/II-fold pyridoxal phosphate-dependent enzyme, partial [Bacillota bacterium]|nr:aminotransferase class I/II-fold pyridoxal phosphate-dependent enzyme [Bacillota bacterium]
VRDSVKSGKVRYSPGPGTPELREALAFEMTSRGRATKPEEIIVTPGAKFAIAASFLLFLDAGDEVIMPDPGYPPDEFWARYQKADIKYFKFQNPRRVDVEHLDKLITPKTKLIVFNTPQRPNGQLIENTDEIAAVLVKHPHVTIVSDEIFARVVFEPFKHKSLSYYPELADRTVVIDTFSKSFVMTGFRIGWVAAPEHIAQKYDIVLQNSCTNVSTIIQNAALAALSAPESYGKELVRTLQRKRDIAWNILSTSKTLITENAQGAFYLFSKLPAGLDDKKAVDLLLEHGVAVVHGSAFGLGGAGHIRLTFSLEDEALTEGVQKLVNVIDSL